MALEMFHEWNPHSFKNVMASLHTIKLFKIGNGTTILPQAWSHKLILGNKFQSLNKCQADLNAGLNHL